MPKRPAQLHESMKREKDLAFLRTREDFKQFLTAVEKEATK
jgi:hypothetical protein